MQDKKRLYRTLFTSTLYLSAFTFGGGFVIVPLMKKKFADDLNWIEEDEILDLIAIAQSSPGPIAVNAAIIMGYRIAGITGAFVSVLGTIIPPFVILSVISFFYTAFRDNVIVNNLLKGMQAGIAAVIIDVVINLSGGIIKEKKPLSILIMLSAFIAIYFFKINIGIVILSCAVIGILSAYYDKRNERESEEL